jgi:5'-3' exoribonuclease 2
LEVGIMGVPALFRWLSSKYPKIISTVNEEQPYEVGDEVIPVDTTGPNPNGEEMDNLYLDMNGIVHPCTHPEGKSPPADEEEMMLEIFKYTDRVVNMVRPRRLLMIAVGMYGQGIGWRNVFLNESLSGIYAQINLFGFC